MSEKIRAAAEKSTRDSFAMTVYSDGVRDGVRAERERIIRLLQDPINKDKWIYATRNTFGTYGNTVEFLVALINEGAE